MKKVCQYCGKTFNKKELKIHINEHLKHFSRVKNFKDITFKCGDGCTATCCKGTSAFLSIGDINRISNYLNSSIDSFLKKYTRFSVADLDKMNKKIQCSFVLKGPCPFFENSKCRIYEVRPFMCRIFPFNLILFKKLSMEPHLKTEFEATLQSYIHDPKALCFHSDFKINESEEDYYLTLWDVLTVEAHLTKKILQIIDKKLFNSIDNRLRDIISTTANEQIYNATLDEILRAEGIDKEIWNDFKQYFLDNIKEESLNKIYLNHI